MDVILHLGAHRTGTRTFQAFLQANARALGVAGVAVWGPEVTRNGRFAGLRKHPDKCRGADHRRAYRSSGVIRSALAQEERAGTRALIVSDADMMGDQINNLTRARLYPDARLRLERFRAAFGERAVRIAVSVRSYEAYWASVLARALPLGAAFPDADQLDRLVTQPRRWRDVIADTSTVFPNAEVLVWPHERLVAQPERLLALMLGAPVVGANRAARERLNMSPDTRLLAEALRDRGEAGFAAALPARGRNWRPFPPEHAQALRTEYEEDLAWLRNGADGHATFIDDVGRDPRSGTEERGQHDDREAQGLG